MRIYFWPEPSESEHAVLALGGRAERRAHHEHGNFKFEARGARNQAAFRVTVGAHSH